MNEDSAVSKANEYLHRKKEIEKARASLHEELKEIQRRQKLELKGVEEDFTGAEAAQERKFVTARYAAKMKPINEMLGELAVEEGKLQGFNAAKVLKTLRGIEFQLTTQQQEEWIKRLFPDISKKPVSATSALTPQFWTLGLTRDVFAHRILQKLEKYPDSLNEAFRKVKTFSGKPAELNEKEVIAIWKATSDPVLHAAYAIVDVITLIEEQKPEGKLKGLYISHRFESVDSKRHLIVFYKNGAKTELDDLTVRFEAWHKTAIERNVDTMGEAKFDEERYQFANMKAKLYQQIILDAEAGLPIEKYWEGTYEKPNEKKDGTKDSLESKTELREVGQWNGTEDSLKDRKQKAIERTYKQACEVKKTKRMKKVPRKLAREEVDLNMPELKGEQRANMIDNVRNSVQQKLFPKRKKTSR